MVVYCGDVYVGCFELQLRMLQQSKNGLQWVFDEMRSWGLRWIACHPPLLRQQERFTVRALLTV